jgi:DNA repair exonuclease SbcCD ATPase subunit
MPTWQVTFDIERENKSGGVTKGFTTFVKSPGITEQVRWENWSGGETQRLQLAGDLGLANLIMQQLGLTNTIEFWDEPSTHLSPEGLADLATLLNERALSEGKRIWIVDHTAMTNFGDFKGVITARKINNVSNLDYTSS